MDNLYGDKEVQRHSNKIIDIDLDLPENTLLKCIRMISSVVDAVPENQEITIYFVCSGRNKFICELLKYIKNLPNSDRFKLIFRGKFPFESLPLIFAIQCDVLINEYCKFIIRKESVYDFLMNNKDSKILETFISRFTIYSQYNSNIELSVIELEKLGYQFNKF